MVSSLFQGIQDGMEEAVHAIIGALGFKRDKRMLSQFCIHELRFRQRVWALGAGSRTRGSSTHAHGGPRPPQCAHTAILPFFPEGFVYCTFRW
jgi:hypothetical protein